MNEVKGYRFYLQRTFGPSEERQVYPVWGDSLRLAMKRLAGAANFETKLEGELSIQGEDYAWLRSFPYESRYRLRIARDYWDGSADETWYQGLFRTQEGKDWNDDERRVDIQDVTTDDRYRQLRAGVNREFSLPELSPNEVPLEVPLVGVAQYYIEGATTIESVNLAGSWSTEVTPMSDPVELDRMGFSLVQELYYLAGDPAQMTHPSVLGFYTESAIASRAFEQVGGAGWIIYRNNTGVQFDPEREYAIGDANANLVYYTQPGKPYLYGPGDTQRHNHLDNFFAPDPAVQVGVTGKARFYNANLWVRVLSPKPGAFPNANDVRAEDDIYPGAKAFRFSARPPAGVELYMGSYVQVGATEFGRLPAPSVSYPGQYHRQPVVVPIAPESWVAVAPNEWAEVSFWVVRTANMTQKMNDQTENLQVRGAFKLSSLVSSLLAKVAPQVTHVDNAAHSELLYGTQAPMRAYASTRALIMAPKRFLVQPTGAAADSQKLKLQDAFDWLWNLLQAQWHVDAQNRLRVESVEWYERGGSYTSELVALDLTAHDEGHLKQSWDTGTNLWNYDSEDLPGRITFQFAEQFSKAFNGQDIVSGAEEPNDMGTEERRLSQVDTDVEGLVSAANASTSGYVLLECELVNGTWVVTRETVTVPGSLTFTALNARLAWRAIQEAHYRYYAPHPSLQINGRFVTALSVRKTRTQEATGPRFPAYDQLGLCRTGLGLGRVEELAESLATGETNIKLLLAPQAAE